MTTEENTRKRKLPPATERQEAIDKLFEEGGFLLLNETLVSVHKSEPAAEGQKWEIIDYGIPAVIATKDKKVVIYIADANTGVPRHNFNIEVSSRYTALKDHFHVFRYEDSESFVYGLNFPDVGIAKKLFSAISHLVPSDLLSDLEGDKKRVAVDGGEEDETEQVDSVIYGKQQPTELNIPEQPERDALLNAIRSFDPTKQLRKVTREDIAQHKNKPGDPYSLESILKAGLKKMRAVFEPQYSRMASISNNGEVEEEEDEFAIKDLLFVK